MRFFNGYFYTPIQMKEFLIEIKKKNVEKRLSYIHVF